MVWQSNELTTLVHFTTMKLVIINQWVKVYNSVLKWHSVTDFKIMIVRTELFLSAILTQRCASHAVHSIQITQFVQKLDHHYPNHNRTHCRRIYNTAPTLTRFAINKLSVNSTPNISHKISEYVKVHVGTEICVWTFTASLMCEPDSIEKALLLMSLGKWRNLAYFQTRPANFLLSRPNAAAYSNSEKKLVKHKWLL